MSDELYEEATKAITEVFNDKSVSISQCRENLNGLLDVIEILLDSLDCDEEET